MSTVTGPCPYCAEYILTAPWDMCLVPCTCGEDAVRDGSELRMRNCSETWLPYRPLGVDPNYVVPRPVLIRLNNKPLPPGMDAVVLPILYKTVTVSEPDLKHVACRCGRKNPAFVRTTAQGHEVRCWWDGTEWTVPAATSFGSADYLRMLSTDLG